MKNILLTGSGGFIGKHLKEYLSHTYNLLTPRSYELNLLDKNELNKYFKENKIDFVIHCASYGVRITPDATLKEITKPNVEMFKNLSHYVTKKCPMITIGSGAEYDKSRALCKIKEDEFGKLVPKDAYGYSKYLISKEIEKIDNILNLRLFGIYGYLEDKSRVTSCIINDYINKRPISLNQNVVFDFIYIDDFCKIIKYFINNLPDEKFINVSPTESIETLELANIVNKFSDYKSEITFKKDGYNLSYTGDNSKLLKEIPDLKFTPYKDGLYELYCKITNNY